MFISRFLLPQELLLRSIRTSSNNLVPYVWVKTNLINHKCCGIEKNARKKGWFFRGGDWDLRRKSLCSVHDEDPRYLFYKEYFIDNLPINKTLAYDYYRERQSKGRPRKGFENEEAIIARLEGYVTIFREVERAGKLTPSFYLTGRRSDEIGCVLCRHGNIMKLSNGNNRFAIARILELPTIPVQIDFIHINLLGHIQTMPGLFPSQKINRFLVDRIGVNAGPEDNMSAAS